MLFLQLANWGVLKEMKKNVRFRLINVYVSVKNKKLMTKFSKLI